ncbi:6-pyruvoyl tetrahydropterin synthase family protein [Haloarcula sp. 1CSR25-25]|uniref:6-pyruvoyl trahydropterin synthase family protein n=1 Tax=Haloarcula sp. 1CSR25-25 TaxID=2862545 RepID=UPI002894859C|nr:6-pyruvoyl tetrahydropterin synthase family protein [Haloarcula sp. 1CSR25-25]MDT3433251.1 6-pyruvoyl tetrahydropterin synthase family protein [Haloarcula sp. 1CSR25-25]
MAERLSERKTTDSIIDTPGERALCVGEDRPIRISSGHRIMHHDGKCSRPHGHNYKVQVSVIGELTDEGWVVDKGDITSVINEWDHRFLVEKGDPLIDAFEQSGDGDALVILEHPPTAEVMAVLLEEKLTDVLPKTVSDVSVSVKETGELCAAHS